MVVVVRRSSSSSMRGCGQTVNANECTKAWMPCRRRPAQNQRRTSARQPVFEGWLVLPRATNQRGWSGIGCQLGTSCFRVRARAQRTLVSLRPVCLCTLVPLYPCIQATPPTLEFNAPAATKLILTAFSLPTDPPARHLTRGRCLSPPHCSKQRRLPDGFRNRSRLGLQIMLCLETLTR